MSAVPLAVTVTVGRVPAPAVTGAVHVLNSVWSGAVVVVSRVQVFPAESVTDLAVALPELQVPTSTTSRSPVPTACGGVSFSDAAAARPDTCCTNAGDVAAPAEGAAKVPAPVSRPTPKSSASSRLRREEDH